jgi:E3 ubiquitin-protein ligase TRIP12
LTDLQGFTVDELSVLLAGDAEDWSLETLGETIKSDHGYTMSSSAVRNLLEVMSMFTPEQRRDFLAFVTGSPRLPLGGFRNLSPPLTVVCKKGGDNDYLPSVMTCVNYLKLPDYSSKGVLKEKLELAMNEGKGCFHLS